MSFDGNLLIRAENYNKKEKKLFVHYGAKHFQKEKFIEVRNGDNEFNTKPIGGLWGSPVDAKKSWLQWCLENDFRNYAADECFYFRLAFPHSWITIHNKREWEKLPKREGGIGRYKGIDFELIKKRGIDNRYPLFAIETSFDDYDEYCECFPGYDCDSVIVLDDSIIIENYDAKHFENPLCLRDLRPIYFFKEIRKDILVSCLLRSPDDKAYIY